jgi:hypothetical protein
MRSRFLMSRMVFVLGFVLAFALGVSAQDDMPQAQEISEVDGIPVIIKHLPEWERVRANAVLIKSPEGLRRALGDRPVFDLIDFAGGTEAVTASYEAGKLLIVEFNTPQASIDADEKVKARLSGLGPNSAIAYRRTGNYNIFVFDVTDETEAEALMEQVKYEKIVQWLGEDPFLYERAERNYARGLSDLFISTVLAIASGLGISVLFGVGVGAIVFYFRKRQRDTWEKFSDAGGMLRLNLDDLQETRNKRLLK